MQLAKFVIELPPALQDRMLQSAWMHGFVWGAGSVLTAVVLCILFRRK